MPKIKTVHQSEYGGTRITSIGILSFDKDGFAEVPEGKSEEAKKLCANSISLQWITGDTQSANSKPIPPAPKKEDTPPPTPPGNLEEGSQNDTGSEQGSQQQSEEQQNDTGSEENTDQQQGPSDEEVAALKELLGEKSIEELRKLCKDAQIPEEDYMKEEFKGAKNKENLVQFMIDKKIGLD